jgi:hypothetical protein
MTAIYVSGKRAAKELGIGWRTFEKRRKAGDPICQPDYTDPDSGRRQYDLLTLNEARAELGRIKARSAT